ncbi:hypothetical protein GQR58_023219 [Nymphon striatum]|nr:hypothetical protein GQR58_023219 [Nymphon striatum]
MKTTRKGRTENTLNDLFAKKALRRPRIVHDYRKIIAEAYEISELQRKCSPGESEREWKMGRETLLKTKVRQFDKLLVKLNKYGYAETTSHLRAINIWSMASDWEAFATQEDSPKQLSKTGKGIPGPYVPRSLCSPVPMFPGPMFPGPYVPRSLCSPVPMSPGPYVPRSLCSPAPMFPGPYVPRSLCSPVPMFPGLYVPRSLCSPVSMFPGLYVPRSLCSPVSMFPGLYVPRSLCSPRPAGPVNIGTGDHGYWGSWVLGNIGTGDYRYAPTGKRRRKAETEVTCQISSISSSLKTLRGFVKRKILQEINHYTMSHGCDCGSVSLKRKVIPKCRQQLIASSYSNVFSFSYLYVVLLEGQDTDYNHGESLTMSNEYKALNGVITPRKNKTKPTEDILPETPNKNNPQYFTMSPSSHSKDRRPNFSYIFFFFKPGNCIRFQELMEQNRVEFFPKLTELTMGRFIEPRLLARVLRACEKSTAKLYVMIKGLLSRSSVLSIRMPYLVSKMLFKKAVNKQQITVICASAQIKLIKQFYIHIDGIVSVTCYLFFNDWIYRRNYNHGSDSNM